MVCGRAGVLVWAGLGLEADSDGLLLGFEEKGGREVEGFYGDEVGGYWKCVGAYWMRGW